MSKKNIDFFKDKKPWSEVKDELLGCYFKPYVSKILHTRKPLIYVDCFAGKGKFDDGKPGSPLIALDTISGCLQSTAVDMPIIETYFIELNYADELMINLKDYPNAKVISGKYEETIESILKDKRGNNVFLYIDPYGIKALKCSIFDDLASGRFNSIELLINMNSFGFIREACNSFGLKYNDENVFEDLVEYEPSIMDASQKSINDLNEIAGGDYWQTIIHNYRNKYIDGYEAEAIFSHQYCDRLKQSYKYVLNMPLRIKRGQRPKYRMIHATNHVGGCILMVDNICNRWQVLEDIQRCGQLQLWDENYENEIVYADDIEQKVKDHLSNCSTLISLNEVLAEFFVTHGVICSTTTVKKIVRNLEMRGHIEVVRMPAETPKGRQSTFMDEVKGKSIKVRWVL